MADPNPRSPRERLPIKLILPKQGQKKKVLGGGKAPEPFRTVNQAYRSGLSNQVAAVRETLDTRQTSVRTTPVRVKIINKAAAKSHRPEHLFSDKTCPIIGGGRLGELFVKATTDGLKRLTEAIGTNTTDLIIKELSCVETIEAVTPMLRRHNREPADILQRSPRRGNGFITRVNLFTYGDADDANLVENFKEICEKQGIRLDQRGYSPENQTYAAECRSVADIEALSRIVGVRSIRHMPVVRTIRPRVLAQQQLPVLPVRDPSNTDLPVVVVVDSGITTRNPALNSWVVGRIIDVSPPYDQNTDHGTFVAGLICYWRFRFMRTHDSGACEPSIPEHVSPAFRDMLVQCSTPDSGPWEASAGIRLGWVILAAFLAARLPCPNRGFSCDRYVNCCNCILNTNSASA